jgi:hypothetical protein
MRLAKDAEMAKIIEPRRQHEPNHRRTARSKILKKCFEHDWANNIKKVL